MTDKEYLTHLEERINGLLNECDHYASSGVITLEYIIDELYQLTDERNALAKKLKNDTRILVIQC